MLAAMGSEPFDHDDWLHEPKLDGFRIHAHVQDRTVRLLSRGNADYTAYFPAIAAALAKQRVQSMVLDAEVVAFDDAGQPSFQALQQLASRAPGTGAAPAVLFSFDLLHVDGLSTRREPYWERRLMLEQALQQSDRVQLVHSDPAGVALFQSVAAMDMEGLVAKRRSSFYQPGVRSPNWLKILAFKRADFLVLGYKGRERVDALLFGYRRNGKIVFGGEVTGLAGLAASLLPVLQTVSPASPLARIPGARWIAPIVTVEIRYREVLKSGRLRHPIFYRLRDELAPADGDFPAVFPPL